MAKTLEAGKLIIGAVACYVEPTGTAASLLGIDTTLQIKDWFTGRADVAKLSKELDARYKARLAEQRFDKPADARALLPQMLEHGAMPGQSMAKAGLDPDLIFTEMKKRIPAQEEYETVAISTAFEELVLPLLTKACNDPRLKTALDPALTQVQMRDQRETKADVKTVIDDVGALKEQLDELLARTGGVEGAASDAENLSIVDLQTLAQAFGNTTRTGREALTQYLTQKAEEHKELIIEVEALKGLSGRIDNIHAAALDAAKRLKLDEAQALIDSAKEIHQQEVLRPALDSQAKLLEAEARIALLRGRPDQAYAIFCTAADAFRELDVIEYARRRNNYCAELFGHGLRYGGPGLALSSKIIRPAISLLADTEHRQIWAEYTHTLAITLENQSDRAVGPLGTTLLGEAVQAYRDIQTVVTQRDSPEHWAAIQQNRAVALAKQGTRTIGPEQFSLLTEAVTVFRESQSVFNRKNHPEQWASINQNMGKALQTLGTKTADPEGISLLNDAVEAYRKALSIRTRQHYPEQWAFTQQNLGATLRILGSLTDGPRGRALLLEAEQTFDEILKIFTQQDHPVLWAKSQLDLAGALQSIGRRTAGQDGAASFELALAKYDEAARVLTRQEHPVDWAFSQEDVALLHMVKAGHDSCSNPTAELHLALERINLSLEVFDPLHLPYNFKKADDLRNQILSALEPLPNS